MNILNIVINRLSIKSNDYTSELITNIVFNYFNIEEGREQYYINKRQELTETKPIKLGKFSDSSITISLPLNNDYLSWGNIILKTKLITIKLQSK